MRGVLILVPLLLLLLAACQPKGPLPLGAEVAFDPNPPLLGPNRITIRVDTKKKLSELKVVGDMTHTGMVPVEAEARQVSPGLWETRDFKFTMRGDWVITLEAKDSSRKRYQQEVRITVP